MTTFYEGQKVEVLASRSQLPRGTAEYWRKAKIIGSTGASHTDWMVEFPDGTRAVSDAEHIRALVSEPPGRHCTVDEHGNPPEGGYGGSYLDD